MKDIKKIQEEIDNIQVEIDKHIASVDNFENGDVSDQVDSVAANNSEYQKVSSDLDEDIDVIIKDQLK
jgi:hypothetical protein